MVFVFYNSRMTEREKKYMINEESYNKIISLFNLSGVMQNNFYFSNGVCDEHFFIRIREKQNEFELTLKIRKSIENGLFIADEINVPISKETFLSYKANGLSIDDVRNIFKVNVPKAYSYIGCLTTIRNKFNYKNIVLELDKNIYFNTTDYELECELQQNEESVLSEFLNTYLYNEYSFSTKTKMQRFLEVK